MNMNREEPPNTWMWYFECDLVEEGTIIDVDRISLKNRQHADTHHLYTYHLNLYRLASNTRGREKSLVPAV